jgi:hypothetical protein
MVKGLLSSFSEVEDEPRFVIPLDFEDMELTTVDATKYGHLRLK